MNRPEREDLENQSSRGIYPSGVPFDELVENVDLAEWERKIFQSPTMHLLENVPLLGQYNAKFCGYASLVMMLRFHQYPIDGHSASQEDIFRLTQDSEYDPLIPVNKQPDSPEFPTFVQTTRNLLKDSDLQPDFFGPEDFESFKQRSSKITINPFTLLDFYLTVLNVPAMVRIPGHIKLAVGVDETSPIIEPPAKIYVFNDPNRKKRSLELANNFDRSWGNRPKESDLKHEGDTRYMMMAIRRKRTK